MIWLILKALLNIVPVLVQAYRDGRLKSASEQAVLDALTISIYQRALDAQKAKQGELSGEDDDPNNRARPRFDGMHDGDSKPPLSVG